MRKSYKSVKTPGLVVLITFLLSFSFVHAQPETSYIIVHALNPEGIEIASIEGMDSHCVEIYDGDTLIGYGAHDNETYNKPIATTRGAHTIRAKFNAMTLEQSVNLEPGEMKILVFMFSRTTFNLIEKIGNCSIESSISGEWSGPSSKIYDTKICSNNSGWKTETHFWESCHYRSGVYDLKARLSFQISENDISWSNYVYADIDESTYAVCPSSHYPNTTPYWHAVGSATNSEGIELDTFSPDFDNWYLQYTNFCEGVSLKIDGIEYLEIQGDYLVKTISANQNSFLNLTWGKYLSVTGGNARHYFYGGRLDMWNEFEESGGGPFRMLMSSVPYDFTGTGIKYAATQPPVASFVYSPEEPLVGEEMNFDASTSYDPDGTVVRYDWDFGDGNTAEGREVTYTYAESGEYTVTLTVTDDDGLTDSTEVSFILGPTLEILDGVDFSSGIEISDNPDELASGGVSVKGAVTDGVTRLLLRLALDELNEVMFSLEGTGNPEEDGLLRSIDGTQEGSSVTVTTVNVNEQEYAFAIYQAPENFVRFGYAEDEKISERTITLNVKSTRSPAFEFSEEIRLVRPPVILVHGLWSSSERWINYSNGLEKALPGIRIFTPDYKKKNASHFEDNKDIPYNCKNGVREAKEKLKSEEIAMVQADVIGHSMGGLLARIWAGLTPWGEYKRDKNFHMGDINKLITIDSPHYGSFIADFVIAFIDSLDPVTKNLLLEYVRKEGFPLDEGAIDDMMTTSPKIILMNVTSTELPSHTIAGDFVVNVDLSLIPGSIGTFFKILKGFGFDTSPDIIPGESDIIVSVESQKGGLVPPASSTFNHHHWGDVNNKEVVNKVIELLNGESGSSSFRAGFPLKWIEW